MDDYEEKNYSLLKVCQKNDNYAQIKGIGAPTAFDKVSTSASVWMHDPTYICSVI